MWPIFFHLESHLWIFYLFFVNGLLIHFCVRGRSDSYRSLTQTVEAQVLAGFFLSISLNGLILAGLDYIDQTFFAMAWIIPSLSVVLAVMLWRVIKSQSTKSQPIKLLFSSDFSIWRLFLYLIVFIILFYNGGMIEQITDAWWHMSLANKIALGSSFDTEFGHLIGSSTRGYPPLWHGNLALIQISSGISLPVIWNSFTAWGGVLKLMAFFLFSLGLTKNSRTATLAVVLFMLLPGIGNSYLRVSAWPSHISYAAWFAMFFVGCNIIEHKGSSQSGVSFTSWIGELKVFVIEKLAAILTICCLALVVFYTHRVELLWFALAWFAYWVVCSIRTAIFMDDVGAELYQSTISKLVYRVSLLVLLGFSVWFLVQKNGNSLGIDRMLAYCFPVFLIGTLISVEFFQRRALALNIGLLVSSALVLLISISYTHLYSLFDASYALASGSSNYQPMKASGFFGGVLALPGWHLQLREGLLYSGILSLPISFLVMLVKPTRTSIFLFACALLAFVFCVSPYLYQWMQDILSYHSPWRIAVLFFHPLLLAILLSDAIKSWHRP